MATLFNEENTVEQMVLDTLPRQGWRFVAADALGRAHNDVFVESMVQSKRR